MPKRTGYIKFSAFFSYCGAYGILVLQSRPQHYDESNCRPEQYGTVQRALLGIRGGSIGKHRPGDKVKVKLMRDKKEKDC